MSRKRRRIGNVTEEDIAEANELLQPLPLDFHWLSAPFRYSKPHYWNPKGTPGTRIYDVENKSLKDIYLYLIAPSLELARKATEGFGRQLFVDKWKELDNLLWLKFITLLVHMDAHPSFSAEDHFRQPVHPRVKKLGIGLCQYRRIIRSVRLYDVDAKRKSGESVKGGRKYDPLFKVRDYLNTTMRQFQAARQPSSPRLALDEEMAACQVQSTNFTMRHYCTIWLSAIE